MSYDPDLRRDTPLALKLKERIRRSGPITVAEYMQACLQDPEHGYYVDRAAIGAKGDFVTAPEISQVFGELIGLWSAVVWQQMGAPAEVRLVELGPGRGTLMRDALRAARVLPGFLDAVEVHLVDSNRALRQVQAETLRTTGPTPVWHADLTTLPGGTAVIVLANEFLDTCPVEQIEHVSATRAAPRRVGLDSEGRLQFVTMGEPGRSPFADAATAGIEERQDFSFVRQINRLMDDAPIAALLVDYGHAEPLRGDTLQAVRNHAAEHPLTSPGEVDLTVQVDFLAFRSRAEESRQKDRWPGAVVDGPVTQAEFLGDLGILPRASRLMSANPSKAHEIEAGVARLLAVPGMGDRFKVVAMRSPALPPLPGFPPRSQ